MQTATDQQESQHVELILQQIDSLPTLSTVATRVLELSGSSDGAMGEIIRLVESDPALSAKLLAMCRGADKGLSQQVETVERAVVLLGLEAVRAALLSVQVFELIGTQETSEAEDLEDAPEDFRPLYVGFMNSLSFPFMLSPALGGWIVYAFGFSELFIVAMVFAVVSLVVSARLSEPRGRIPDVQSDILPE